MKRVKLKNDELAYEIIRRTKEFPKYTTQLMNLANRNAQGTRPKFVGQMTELIQEFKGENMQNGNRGILKRSLKQ